MRKCDICSTPIPLGQDRCPNCGYIYRAETKVNGENPDTKLNTTRKDAKMQQYMSQFQQHPFVKSVTNSSKKLYKTPHNYSFQMKRPVIIGCIVAFCILFIIGNVVPSIIEIVDNFDGQYDEIADYEEDIEQFDDIEILRSSYAEIAEQMEPYYKRLMDYPYNMEISHMYENYQVDDDEFDSGYMSIDFFEGEIFYNKTIYNFGFGWDETFQMSKTFEKDKFYNKQAMKEYATLADVDDTLLYERCLEAYETAAVEDDYCSSIAYYDEYELEFYMSIDGKQQNITYTLRKTGI